MILLSRYRIAPPGYRTNSGPLPGRWRHFFMVSGGTRRIAAACSVVSMGSSLIRPTAIGVSVGASCCPIAGLRTWGDFLRGLAFGWSTKSKELYCWLLVFTPLPRLTQFCRSTVCRIPCLDRSGKGRQRCLRIASIRPSLHENSGRVIGRRQIDAEPGDWTLPYPEYSHGVN